MHCTVSSAIALKHFLRTLPVNIASPSFLPLQLPLFLSLPSQIYNLFFLQWIYNWLCPFSIDSMNMRSGPTTWKWITYAGAPPWRTLLLSQQPLTTCSFSVSFLFTILHQAGHCGNSPVLVSMSTGSIFLLDLFTQSLFWDFCGCRSFVMSRSWRCSVPLAFLYSF